MENTNHGRQIILCQIIDSPIRHAVEIEQVLVVRDGPILPLEGVVRGLVLLNRIQFWPRKKRKKERKEKKKVRWLVHQRAILEGTRLGHDCLKYLVSGLLVSKGEKDAGAILEEDLETLQKTSSGE